MVPLFRDKELRGQGISTRQMRTAPVRCLYLIPGNSMSGYFLALAVRLNRLDIQLVLPSSLRLFRNFARPLVIDHAVWYYPTTALIKDVIAYRHYHDMVLRKK